MGKIVTFTKRFASLKRCIGCAASSPILLKPEFIMIISLLDNWCKKCIEHVSVPLFINSLCDTFFVFKKLGTDNKLMHYSALVAYVMNFLASFVGSQLLNVGNFVY